MKITGPLAEKGMHAYDDEPKVHAGHKIPRIWFVVADRQKAHIYRKTGNSLELIADARAVGQKTKAGKSVDGEKHILPLEGANLRHVSDPGDKKKRHNDASFIHALADWLDLAEKEKVFDRLVIVAASHTMGDIRAALPRNVDNLVTAEINKDLTGVSVKEIYEHLDNVVWF